MKYTDAIMLDTSAAGRDLDYACLRVCPVLDKYAPAYDNDSWTKRYWYGSVPPYSTDPIAARLLEDEIERRGLHFVYVRELLRITLLEDGAETPSLERHRQWALIRATPEQRARAFLAALEAK